MTIPSSEVVLACGHQQRVSNFRLASTQTGPIWCVECDTMVARSANVQEESQVSTEGERTNDTDESA
jgi:hypothetical protein